MISKNELSKVLAEVVDAVKSECGSDIPGIAQYDVTLDGRYGMDHICSLSIDRKIIVVNFERLRHTYPYMDADAIKDMLTNTIIRTIRSIIEDDRRGSTFTANTI